MQSLTDENSPQESDTPPADSAGGATVQEQAQLETVFQQAVGGGDSQSDPPPPPRKPGVRGPDKKKRKGVSMAPMDDSPRSPLFTDNPAAGTIPIDFENFRPPVDDTALRASMAGIERIAETLAVLYVAGVAKKETGNAEIINRTSEAAKPTPEVRELLINGGVGCWKKYFPNVQLGPEVELLGALGLWGNQIRVLIVELRALGAAQREKSAA